MSAALLNAGATPAPDLAPKPPTTAAAPVAAAPAGPVIAQPGELFRPLRHRRFWLSPDGRFLIETVNGDRLATQLPAGVSFGSAPWWNADSDGSEDVLITDLVTKRFQKVRMATSGSAVGSVIWLDARHFVWVLRRRDKSMVERVEMLDLPPDATGVDFVTAVTIGRDIGILAAVPGEPQRILVIGADLEGASVYRVDPQQPLAPQMTPVNRMVGPFMGLVDLVVDQAGALRAVILARRFGERRVLWRADEQSPWRTVYDLPADPYLGIELAGVSAAGTLLVVTNAGTSRSVLRELLVPSGKLGPILIEHPRHDVTTSYLSSNTTRLLGVWYGDAQIQVEFMDPDLKRMQQDLVRMLPGKVPRILSVADDRSRALLMTAESDNPGRYSLFNPADRSITLVESVAPWLRGKALARSRNITFTARDGLELLGQFTPPLMAPASGKPPLVLMPHGGPLGVRDYDLFDPVVQLLASRGYAVLQVDFRGSGGYGRDFLTAGFRQWGLKMQDDLIDAMTWMRAEGLVDIGRTCIFGASYGGYAAMMGVIKTPELFRCGVTLAGVSDLSLFFEAEDFEDDPYVIDLLKEVVGDPDKERATLQARSPAFLAKGLTRPIFIAHGDKDTRVDPEHAWRLRAAIEAGGGKPEWLLLEGEGHGIDKAANLARFYSRLIEFLDRNLAAPASVTASPSPN